MRRYPLPPPNMWPCDRPLVHVLNGDYAAAAVQLRRMTLPGLERLVVKLVQRTAPKAAKPRWWPRGMLFNQPLDLGLSDERDIKSAFQQLIGCCCQFFARTKLHKVAVRPKQQFLRQLGLLEANENIPRRAPLSVNSYTTKLAACVNIPFSSDIGRMMVSKENHSMSEELKLRRLERSEWYTNKGAPKALATCFEANPPKEPPSCHSYKMPKRQLHHKRRSLYHREFLARFCTPLSVVVPRLDLSKLTQSDRKELIVLIKDVEKVNCDVKRDVRIVRTSPRLRHF